MSKVRILVITALFLGLAGCENTSSLRQSLETLNKTLAPLAVLKKGS